MECKKAVREAKRRFEQLIATNGNKRPFNTYITSRTKNRTGVGPLKVDNKMISDYKQMATVLNKSFCSVFTTEDTSNIPNCPPLSNSFIRDIFFEQTEVKEKILKLKPEMEFKEFEPRFKSAKTRFKFSAGLHIEKFHTILSGTNHI